MKLLAMITFFMGCLGQLRACAYIVISLSGFGFCQIANSIEIKTDAQLFLEQANTAATQHNYINAIKFLEQAEEKLNDNDSIRTQLAIQMRKGQIMLNTERLIKAAEYYEKAFYLAQQTKVEKWQVHTITSLAQALVHDYELALEWLERAENITTDNFLLAEIDATRGLIASSNSRYQEAIDYGESAFKVLQDSPKHKKMALAALTGTAYSLLKTNNYQLALEVYNQIIPRSYDIGHWHSVNRAYCNRAEALIHLGEYKRAKDDLITSINGLEQERASIPWTEASRSAYLQNQISAFDNLIVLNADADEQLSALKIVERFQAKNFINLFSQEAVTKAYGIENNLFQQQKDIINQLNNETTPENKKAQLKEQLETLQARIQQANPKYYQLTAFQPIDIESVQFELAENQAIINFWSNEERLFIWVVTTDDVFMRQIPVRKETLKKNLEKWLKPLNNPRLMEQIKLTNTAKNHINTGKELYNWLYFSIEKDLQNFDELIIIPDSLLQNLPFESLVKSCKDDSNNYANCDYLGLNKAIVYNDSMTSWINVKNKEINNSNTILAYAGNQNTISDLPSTLKEVNSLKTIYPQGLFQSGDSATEHNFKIKAQNYGILHIASHGVFNNNIPMNSGLQLYKDNNDDGFLSAYEILNLDLNNELTTLSSCQSGQGQVINGAGLLGLSQAFLKAGSKSVVVSRWKIADEATAIFMKLFYSALNKGQSKAQSLLKARQQMFLLKYQQKMAFVNKQSTYSSPSHWSVFRLNGSP